MADYKISSAIDISKDMLTLTGIWPRKRPSFTYLLKASISYISAALIFAITTLEVILSMQNIYKLSDILFFHFQYFSYLSKLAGFRWNKDTVFKLSENLQDPQLNLYERKYNVFVKKAVGVSRFIGQAYKYNCYVSLTFTLLLPLLLNKPFPVPFPFFHEGAMWFVIYCVEVVGLGTGVWNHCALDTVCVGYMSIALAELDILLEKIKHFEDSIAAKVDAESMATEYLSNCCKHHHKIIEFVNNIEGVFSVGLLAQCAAAIVVICNTGFHLLITPLFSLQFLALSMYFVAVLIELAMYCWFGNEIILKSLEVREACYMSKWYEFGPTAKQIIFIIMERAKRPLRITAYKMAVLSLSAFTEVIQWSYSYYTLLRRLYVQN